MIKFVEPTRKYQGCYRSITNPTDVTYRRQISALTDRLEFKCNNLWQQICSRRSLDSKMSRAFKVSNTQLPAMYVLVKTHKFDVNVICSLSDIVDKCKVRPIVSCCSSPTEKLAWLCTYILTPLLDVIPCHLKSIYDHLERLSHLTPQQIVGRKFCSGDISSLYTNINIQSCIDDVISLASEYQQILCLYGLKLSDIQEMLEVILGDSFFTYNSRVFRQLIGLFMGCKPSPICAIVRVYTFERRSIYTDINYISIPYGKYIDDAYTLANTEEDAMAVFQTIAEQDPDELLKWEIDFPRENSHFQPFLGTAVRIEESGEISFKYYRKTQKNITLHFRSHHPMKTNVEVVKNFYITAEKSSSNPQLAEESKKVIDGLLKCNGYSDPRSFQNTHIKSPKMDSFSKDEKVCLKLTYISEYVSYETLRYIRRRKLPIHVIFTPGKKLRDIFCSSRPLDRPTCSSIDEQVGHQSMTYLPSCKICEHLEDNLNCRTTHPVYLITCLLCKNAYCGESSRSLNDRLSEHLRYATNPEKPSYRDEAMAVHYRTHHPSVPPKLSFRLLHTEHNTIMREIYEAFMINNLKPKINDKVECISVKRFLVNY